jgi:hypothetical protein
LQLFQGIVADPGPFRQRYADQEGSLQMDSKFFA